MWDDNFGRAVKMAKDAERHGWEHPKLKKLADILKKVYPSITFDMAWGNKKEFPPKPDKASLLKLLELAGMTEKDCLYIGDSNVDVFTAQNAGVDMLGVEWGFRDRQELMEAGAPIVVDTAEKIWEYINE